MGKFVETDEFLVLTEQGQIKARAVKRLAGAEAWDADFAAKLWKGSPGDPTGRAAEGVVRGTALDPANRIRRMYITQQIVQQ